MESKVYQPKVLLIDDTPDVRAAFKALLESEGYRFFEAENGTEGIKQAIKISPDLIFLDVMMPGMDGFETCIQLRKNKVIADIPIIMVTALDDKESKIKGLESGADDFLSKPIDTLIFKARVKTIINLNRHQKLKSREIQLQNTLNQTVSLLNDLMSLSIQFNQEDSERIIQVLSYLANKLKLTDSVQLKHAAQLLNIGKLALPSEILEKHDSGEKLTAEELHFYKTYPSISKTLVSKISGFERVGEIISFSMITNKELASLNTNINHPAFLGHLIYCTKAMDKLMLEGFSPKLVETEMLKNSDKYHPKIASLLKHATPIMYESTPTLLSVKELRVGMLCHEDIKSTQGTSILKQGEVINQVNLEKILVFSLGVGVQEPFTIMRRVVSSSKNNKNSNII
jgi:putative two-component system response regulator